MPRIPFSLTQVLQRELKLPAEQEEGMEMKKYDLRAIVLEGTNLGMKPQNTTVEVCFKDHTWTLHDTLLGLFTDLRLTFHR